MRLEMSEAGGGRWEVVPLEGVVELLCVVMAWSTVWRVWDIMQRINQPWSRLI